MTAVRSQQPSIKPLMGLLRLTLVYQALNQGVNVMFVHIKQSEFRWVIALLMTRRKFSPSAAFSTAAGVLVTALNPRALASSVDNPRWNAFLFLNKVF